MIPQFILSVSVSLGSGNGSPDLIRPIARLISISVPSITDLPLFLSLSSEQHTRCYLFLQNIEASYVRFLSLVSSYLFAGDQHGKTQTDFAKECRIMVHEIFWLL